MEDIHKKTVIAKLKARRNQIVGAMSIYNTDCQEEAVLVAEFFSNEMYSIQEKIKELENEAC